jgi:hypothetical protein
MHLAPSSARVGGNTEPCPSSSLPCDATALPPLTARSLFHDLPQMTRLPRACRCVSIYQDRAVTGWSCRTSPFSHLLDEQGFRRRRRVYTVLTVMMVMIMMRTRSSRMKTRKTATTTTSRHPPSCNPPQPSCLVAACMRCRGRVYWSELGRRQDRRWPAEFCRTALARTFATLQRFTRRHTTTRRTYGPR